MENFFDCFGKDASELKKKKLFLFDMDGTIYNDGVVFDGTIELLSKIKENKGKYVFLTNNSSKSVQDYVDRLSGLGIVVDYNSFCTSSQVTEKYLKKNYKNSKIYCQGTKALIRELKAKNINVTTKVSDDVGVVVVGFDTELTSEKIKNTCQLLMRGIPFIATNKDLVCPVSFGYIPDCGSICMMIENATGRKPIYLGKPEKHMVEFIQEKYDYLADETVIIGDRLYTDILTGVNSGITSICVLTGESCIDDIVKGEIKPTFTFDSVKQLLKIFQGDY